MNRRSVFVGLLLLVVVVGAYLSAARRTEGPPLDPTSTAGDGAAAVVELAAAFGAGVDVVEGVPDGDVDTALLLRDRYERESAGALLEWVEAGGTLVVADVGSSLTPPSAGGAFDEVDVTCGPQALSGVASLDMGDGRTFDAPGSPACDAAVGAVVVVQDRGAGTVVSVGGPDPFTNGLLGEADNAALAVTLLAPTPDTRTAFLQPPQLVGRGDDSLVDLVGVPVRAALAQLVVAFVVLALWRARRLGRPVAERELVAVDSSELTSAVGRLLSQGRRATRAAGILRDRARRDLSARLGLGLDAPADVVSAVIAARTSLSDDEARRAVATPVLDDDDLVVVASLLARIREEATSVRSVDAD